MSLVQQEPARGVRPLDTPTSLLRRGSVRRAAREIALVAVLFFAYKLGRIAASGHVDEAMANATNVWDLERLLHLPSEYGLQQLILGHGTIVTLANCYYAYVHFPVTAACLIGLYLWRPEQYVHFRRMLAWLTAAALAVHLLMPLAPPRMLTAVGMVDTGRVFGPAVYSAPTADSLTNQYAAMPSLHVGWALAVAVALISVTRGRYRWLWLAHPTITLLVVVVTGNHYWLDAIVATALLGLVTVVLTGRAPATTPAIPKPRVGES